MFIAVKVAGQALAGILFKGIKCSKIKENKYLY